MSLEPLQQLMDQNSANYQIRGGGLQIVVCFCHPYASWKRSSNERLNSLMRMRRFIKKGQPIHSYTNKMLEEVGACMNILPRKILNYQALGEVFTNNRKALYSDFLKNVAFNIAIYGVVFYLFFFEMVLTNICFGGKVMN